jgi:hypothetical protein
MQPEVRPVKLCTAVDDTYVALVTLGRWAIDLAIGGRGSPRRRWMQRSGNG